MNNFLKQSTAVTKKLGPFVDATDGVTAKTSLTIAQADIRLSKNGGAFAQSNNAAGATHDEAGYYGVPLDATDVGTPGSLLVSIAVSGALPVWKEFMVVPANVYDAMVLGTDYLQADAVQIEGADAGDTINARTLPTADYFNPTEDAVATVTNLTNAPTSGDLTAAMKASVTAAVPTVAQIWAALTSGLITASSIGKLIVDNLNAAITSRAATGAKMDIVDAPNATAVGVIQTGLATESNALATAGAILNVLGVPAGASLAADIADSGGSGLNEEQTIAAAQAALDAQGYTEARAVKLDYLDAAISGVGGATGSGADTVTLTFTTSGVAVPDLAVWIASSATGAPVVAGTKYTDDFGQVTFLLDAGQTYYYWARKAGVFDVQAEPIVVVAD